MKLPIKFNTSKSDLKVGGRMSERGADIAGIILASSGLVLSLAFAVAIIVFAIHKVYKA